MHQSLWQLSELRPQPCRTEQAAAADPDTRTLTRARTSPQSPCGAPSSRPASIPGWSLHFPHRLIKRNTAGRRLWKQRSPQGGALSSARSATSQHQRALQDSRPAGPWPRACCRAAGAPPAAAPLSRGAAPPAGAGGWCRRPALGTCRLPAAFLHRTCLQSAVLAVVRDCTRMQHAAAEAAQQASRPHSLPTLSSFFFCSSALWASLSSFSRSLVWESLSAGSGEGGRVQAAQSSGGSYRKDTTVGEAAGGAVVTRHCPSAALLRRLAHQEDSQPQNPTTQRAQPREARARDAPMRRLGPLPRGAHPPAHPCYPCRCRSWGRP